MEQNDKLLKGYIIEATEEKINKLNFIKIKNFCSPNLIT